MARIGSFGSVALNEEAKERLSPDGGMSRHPVSGAVTRPNLGRSNREFVSCLVGLADESQYLRNFTDKVRFIARTRNRNTAPNAYP